MESLLSATEQQIVIALLAGQSSREIARARQRSIRTIENQINAVYGKLAVRSRRELAARWNSLQRALAAE